MELKIQNFKNPGQKVADIVENGFNIVVPGLCLMISGWKVLEDGFEDGVDVTQNPKFQNSGTKSGGECRKWFQYCGSGLLPDDF